MPYVEGFGTYPFGEEWLFDAVIRSYLPVLEVAERLTMTVTPVLADQLEDAGRAAAAAGVPGRVADRGGGGRRWRRCRRSAGTPARRSWRATGGRWSCSTRRAATRCGRFSEAAEEGRVALAASAATHAVLPLLATRAGLRLQLDAGIRSHRRRFGWDGGFWLPECAYAPGLEWRLAEHGVRWFCVDQSAHEEPLEALAPVATEAGAGGAADRLGGDRAGSGRSTAIPSDPAHAQFAGKSLRGMRIWKVGGGAYDPAAAEAAARRQAGEFLAAAAARLREFSAARGRRGLLVFAIDTELLGHWWSEGPIWLREVLAGAAAAGVRLLTVPEALAEHEPVERGRWPPPPGARRRTCAPGTRRPSPTSPGAARRLELRLLRALSRRPARAGRRCAPRASCSPSRRATGPSSTSAARRATTPSSAPPATPRRRWRP